ncbi:hypothetical protein METBIDRAFT_27045, partial [Metschnikowia bicuspidata var. bicuspidata NRRL YB-4993]
CTGKCHCKAKKSEKTSDKDLQLTDDVWGSDEESISIHADLQRAHVNQGYLDGITKAQELGLQDGFDKGFPTGASLGIRVGKVLATLHGKSQFKEAQGALNITQVLDKKYFDNQLDLHNSQHLLLQRWE